MPEKRIESLTRQLRITQGVLVIAVVFIGAHALGLGPTPATLRASEGVAVGPNGELTMRVHEAGSTISYGKEGDPSGYDLMCFDDRCTLNLRVHRDDVYEAQLVASELGGLSVHTSKETGDGPRKIERLEASPAMGISTHSGEGSVSIDPSQLMLMKGDNAAYLKVGEAPSLTLSGTNSLRSFQSTDPKPERDEAADDEDDEGGEAARDDAE